MANNTKKPFIERQADRALELQKKAFNLEHRNVLKDDYDNCLICKHASIRENEIVKFFNKMGWDASAEKMKEQFPLVFCTLEKGVYGGKYVPNPKKRPRWCRREEK